MKAQPYFRYLSLINKVVLNQNTRRETVPVVLSSVLAAYGDSHADVGLVLMEMDRLRGEGKFNRTPVALVRRKKKD